VHSFINSVIVSTIGTSLVVVIDVLAAYALSRLHFPGRDALFLVVVASLIVPHEILLIPNYITVWKLDWLNSLAALIIPPAAGGFGVFLLRQFFLAIRGELEDAARIDGCGRFRILWSIVLPVSGGAIATLAIFTFLFFWNDFLMPFLVIRRPEQRTLTLATLAFVQSHSADYGLMMAALVMTVLPIFVMYLFMQRHIIEGMVRGAVK